MSEARVRLTDFIQAQLHARWHESDARKKLGGTAPTAPALAVPQEVFDYIFTLQGEVEKAGYMDYHKYAQRMWSNLVGDPRQQSDPTAAQNFEAHLIAGLHNIDMTQHVYPLFKSGLEGLVQRYPDVKSVALWSTGDVAATGYQAGKIHRSGVIQSLIKHLPHRFVREKTKYRVDDDKFERLFEDTEELLKQEEQVKLVVIEDSRSNLARVEREMNERFGSARVNVIPVWAAYSREGIEAAKKAESEGSVLQLNEQKISLNVLDRPEDLLDVARLGSLFKDAHVYVDFDGVIGNNITMRQEQARVIYSVIRVFCD